MQTPAAQPAAPRIILIEPDTGHCIRMHCVAARAIVAPLIVADRVEHPAAATQFASEQAARAVAALIGPANLIPHQVKT